MLFVVAVKNIQVRSMQLFSFGDVWIHSLHVFVSPIYFVADLLFSVFVFFFLQGIFIKEFNSLAYYNVTPSSVVQLQLKERGGRKKWETALILCYACL